MVWCFGFEERQSQRVLVEAEEVAGWADRISVQDYDSWQLQAHLLVDEKGLIPLFALVQSEHRRSWRGYLRCRLPGAVPGSAQHEPMLKIRRPLRWVGYHRHHQKESHDMPFFSCCEDHHYHYSKEQLLERLA